MPRKRKQLTADATTEPPTKKPAIESAATTETIILPIATQPTSSPPPLPITDLKQFKFSNNAFQSICGKDSKRFSRGMEIYNDCGSIFAVCKLLPSNTSSSPCFQFEGKVPGNHKSFYRCSITCTQLEITKREHVSWSCNCPDWGDPCKHIIAFCKYLSVNGNTIALRQPIQQHSQNMTKEELIEMLQHLCNTNSYVENRVSAYIYKDKDVEEEDKDESEEEEGEDEEEEYYKYSKRYF